MNFRISDTFTDSLARLTGDEPKAAKTTACDLQMDLPVSPGVFVEMEVFKSSLRAILSPRVLEPDSNSP